MDISNLRRSAFPVGIALALLVAGRPAPAQLDCIDYADYPHREAGTSVPGDAWGLDLQVTADVLIPRPETELRDWEAWRDMWLAARAHLSGQPHIPIHRWTGDSPACA